MKLLLAALLALAAPFSMATQVSANLDMVEATGSVDLYQGSKKISTHPDYIACKSRVASFGVASTFTCRTITTLVTKLIVPAKPQDEVRSMSCPAGSVPGAVWQQTRDYVRATPPVYWKVTDWTPAVMPATACPPAPPPPTMHAGWPGIDEKSFDLNVTPGSRQILITPPADFDCKTAADAVPGCTWPGFNDGTGAFRNVAYRTKLGWFDPIVHPGMDNSAHLHQFVGNTGVNKDSTGASLLADCDSTFRGGAVSCSSVWAPVMVDTLNGRVIPARAAIVYYKRGAWTDAKSIEEIPIGLKMVIGNPTATSYVQWGTSGFSCDGFAVSNDRDFIPENGGPVFTGGSHVIPTLAQCGAGHEVWATAVAPNCWNGKDLYLPDGSHMAYPDSPWNDHTLPNGCQDHHPHLLPQVAALFITRIEPGDDPGRWVLSSDKPYVPVAGDNDQIFTLPNGTKVKRGVTMHIDYFAAIPLPIQKTLLDGCVRSQLECQAHMLGNGHTMNAFNGN